MGNRVSSFPFPELFTMFLWINIPIKMIYVKTGYQNHISYFFLFFRQKFRIFEKILSNLLLQTKKLKNSTKLNPQMAKCSVEIPLSNVSKCFEFFLLIPVNLRYFGTLNRASPVFAYSRTSSTEMLLELLASSVSLTYAATSSPKSSYEGPSHVGSE